MLFGIDYVQSFLTRAIRLAERHGFLAEGYYFGEEVRNMRSARVGVHQSGIGRDGELTLRLRRGKKEVEVVISSPADIGKSVKKAKELMASARPNPLLYPLPAQPKCPPEEALGLQEVPLQFWDDLPAKTQAFLEIQKAEQSNPNWRCAGSFLTAAHEIGVANSRGLLRYSTGYYNSFSVVASGGSKSHNSTFAEAIAALPQEINSAAVVSQAFASARLTDQLPTFNPLDGEESICLDALLSPNCVAGWLADAGLSFSRYAIKKRESILSGKKMGKFPIACRRITLSDDWQHPLSLPVPFDIEGNTRQRVKLIDRGIFSASVNDGMTAVLCKEKPTGHGGFDLNTGSPDVLVLQGQPNTLDDLIASCQKPTLVLTWPHYDSDMYESESMYTFTGHHGVFLAQDGRLVAVCPPMRVRMRTFDALKRVDMMSYPQPIYDTERYPLTLPTSSVVPWMKIRGVEFINL